MSVASFPISCSVGMFSGNACWYWRMGSWDDGREVGGEGLCDLLEIDSERKGRPQQVTVTEMGMRVRGLYLMSGRRCVGLLSLYLLLWEEPIALGTAGAVTQVWSLTGHQLGDRRLGRDR